MGTPEKAKAKLSVFDCNKFIKAHDNRIKRLKIKCSALDSKKDSDGKLYTTEELARNKLLKAACQKQGESILVDINELKAVIATYDSKPTVADIV